MAKQSELHDNTTWLTCSGTMGRAALAERQWENRTANQHMIRAVPATQDIAGYLNTFLAS